MPNLLYKTVAPVLTFFTSGPTEATSPTRAVASSRETHDVSHRVNSSRVESLRVVRSFVRSVRSSQPPASRASRRPRAQTLKTPIAPIAPIRSAVVVSIARTARGFTLRALREHDAALGHRFRGRHLDEHAAAARGDRLVLGRNLERGGRARGRGRRATRAGDATRGDGDRNGVRLRRGDHVVDVSRRCVRHEVGEGWMMTCRG